MSDATRDSGVLTIRLFIAEPLTVLFLRLAGCYAPFLVIAVLNVFRTVFSGKVSPLVAVALIVALVIGLVPSVIALLGHKRQALLLRQICRRCHCPSRSVPGPIVRSFAA